MGLKIDRQAFIEAIAPAAMDAQRRYGIPASITIAQACIESGWGTSRLFKQANNMFGIKGTYNGDFLRATDDAPNEKFKKYPSLGHSIADHSDLLGNKKNYARCRQCAQDDYKGWAHGLKAAGYATAKNYASALISTVEKSGLQKYDAEAKSMGSLPKNAPLPTVEVSGAAHANSNSVVAGGAGEKGGTDLAAGLAPASGTSTNHPAPVDQTQDPETWVKKLLAGSNVDTGDAMVDILMSFLFGTTAIAQAIEGKEKEDSKARLMETAKQTASSGKLDLTAAVPGAEKCVMDFSGDGNPVITTKVDGKEQTHQVTDEEKRKMSVIAKDSRRTPEEKAEQMAVAASIVVPSSAPSMLAAKQANQSPAQVQKSASSNFDLAINGKTPELKSSFTFNIS